MPNIKDGVYFEEVMLLFQTGVVEREEGMGELYDIRMMVVWSVPDPPTCGNTGLCGRKSTGFVGKWVVCLHVMYRL